MNALSILHLDLDAFFASVEQRERPELRGRPVAVGGDGDRGVVAAASYEARAFGVRSAMPSVRARRVCPHLVFVAPRIDLYREVSEAVMAILATATPLVEPLSLDEAFLDVSGAQRLLGTAPEIAEMLRARIANELGLRASVGVATTKMLAKIASDSAKPDGMLVVPVGTELEFLHPLPVVRLWGVGPSTRKKLARLGVDTVGDLAAIPEATLWRAVGRAAGTQLHALAWNRDARSVRSALTRRSVGHEETFAVDRVERKQLERDVVRMADLVAQRLRASSTMARTVQLKVRYADFTMITRSRTVSDPTDMAAVIGAQGLTLLAAVDLDRGVRLLGVTATHLEPTVGSAEQLVFDSGSPGRHDALERTLDAVRARFGADSVGRANAPD